MTVSIELLLSHTFTDALIIYIIRNNTLDAGTIFQIYKLLLLQGNILKKFIDLHKKMNTFM